MNRVGTWLLFFIVRCWCLLALPISDKVRVLTNSGTVIGRKTLRKTTGSPTKMLPFYEFFNVPYATPPVGDLRFAAARVRGVSNPWEGEMDASAERDVRCVQATWYPGTDVIGQEDCLYLTIRTRAVSCSRNENQSESGSENNGESKSFFRNYNQSERVPKNDNQSESRLDNNDEQSESLIQDNNQSESLIQDDNQSESLIQDTNESESAPKKMDQSESELLPVVVWVHGGGLLGRSCCRPGYSLDSALTDELKAVTVNINYRLGFLGFHSISELWDEEEGVYANNGIRDMISALQWVQDNISLFGGDPQRVTVVGQSGGGTGALGLMTSPLAVNLFQQLVVMSPAAEFKWSYKQGDEFQRRFSHVIEVTGCAGQSDNEMRITDQSKASMKKCLRNVDARWLTSKISADINPSGRLLDYQNSVGRAWNEFPLIFGAVGEQLGLVMVDPVVVTSSPSEISSAKYLPEIRGKVRVIVSSLSHETVFYTPYHQESFTNKTTVVNLIGSLASSAFNLTKSEITDLITPYLHLPAQMIWDTITSDIRVTCPLNGLAEEVSLSKKHDVYRLYSTVGPSWTESPDSTSDSTFDSTVYHGWDTEALFGFRERLDRGLSVTERDWKYREALVTTLRRFIVGETLVSQREGVVKKKKTEDRGYKNVKKRRTEDHGYKDDNERRVARIKGDEDAQSDSWIRFPEGYILMDSSSVRSVKGQPASDRCSVLRELKLDQYGWQN